LQDVVDDISVPTSWDYIHLTEGKQMVLEKAETSSTRKNYYSRKLNEDEVKGVWMLVGLLAGSWILGGIVNGAPKKFVDEHHSY